MPRVANGLSAERLRELARAGAEQAVKQLRAEIIAIERSFPELKLPSPPGGAAVRHRGGPQDAADVGGGSQGGLGADEAVLGRAAEGTGEGQVDGSRESAC